MFFVQTSSLPPNMHQKLTEHGGCFMQNNQLPTRSHVELEDTLFCWRCVSYVTGLVMLDGYGIHAHQVVNNKTHTLV